MPYFPWLRYSHLQFGQIIPGFRQIPTHHTHTHYHHHRHHHHRHRHYHHLIPSQQNTYLWITCLFVLHFRIVEFHFIWNRYRLSRFKILINSKIHFFLRECRCHQPKACPASFRWYRLPHVIHRSEITIIVIIIVYVPWWQGGSRPWWDELYRVAVLCVLLWLLFLPWVLVGCGAGTRHIWCWSLLCLGCWCCWRIFHCCTCGVDGSNSNGDQERNRKLPPQMVPDPNYRRHLNSRLRT